MPVLLAGSSRRLYAGMVGLHMGLTLPRESTMQPADVDVGAKFAAPRHAHCPLLCAILDVDRAELAHDGLGHLNL